MPTISGLLYFLSKQYSLHFSIRTPDTMKMSEMMCKVKPDTLVSVVCHAILTKIATLPYLVPPMLKQTLLILLILLLVLLLLLLVGGHTHIDTLIPLLNKLLT